MTGRDWRCGGKLRVLLVAWLLSLVAAVAGGDVLGWGVLPPLPDREGFAGVFAGVVSEDGADHLVVAGGANFPEGRPWEGGRKAYYNRVFTLPLGDGGAAWTVRETVLPEALGYGMSVDLPGRGSFLMIGGKGADGGTGREAATGKVWEVTMTGGELALAPWPDLPVPCAEGAGALVGTKVVVAAGATNAPAGAEGGFVVSKKVFVREMHGGGAWDELPWPGDVRGRMHATAGVSGGATFYLFGGRDFAASGEAAADRILGLDFLRDCHAVNIATRQWRRLADLPEARSAAPSTAVPVGASHFLMLGGVPVPFLRDQIAARPEVNGQGEAHPGFPRSILAYDRVTDTWAEAGSIPAGAGGAEAVWAPVTTPVVLWRDRVIVPTGEIKPGVRSPQVLVAMRTAGKASFGWLNWTVVAVYLLGMVGVGYWFMRREAASSTDAYFRGGQRVPWWVAGLSIFATMLSALTFMGIPARAYETDLTWYIGQLPILVVVPLVVFCYLPFFRKLDLTSAYEYLERRFNLASRLFASTSFILFHIGRIAIVLYLPALALAAVSDIGVIPAILVIGVLCVLYTVMGGIQAVVWTDAIQALVLMGGAVLCLVLVVMRVDGGFGGILTVAKADAKLFEGLRWDTLDVRDGTTTALVLFVAFLFNSLVPYTSSQDVVQRYVTTKDIGAARKSLWTTMWMSLFGSMVFFALGVAIYAFYKMNSGALDPALPKTDSILPFFIMQQLPVGVSGLIIAAIFAASQSTISSSLNSVATAWIKDFDARLLRPGRADKVYLGAAKWVVLVIGTAGVGVACVMASSEMEGAFKMFNTLIGLTAGALGGLFALGVFTRRANGKGAFAGALTGFATVVSLYASKAPVTGLLYAFIGFAVCFVSGYLVSLMTGADRGRDLSIHG